MKRAYLVVYEKGKKNYSGFAPDVPGCGSVGDTVEEMRTNLREALELYMEMSLEFGDQLPEPATRSITLPLEGEMDLKATYVVERLNITMPKIKVARVKTPAKRLATLKKSRALQAA